MRSKIQTSRSPARVAAASAIRSRDAALDEALDHTFPASDPIAVGMPTGTEPPRAPVDRKAPAPARG